MRIFLEFPEIKTPYDVCKLNLTYNLKSLILLPQKKRVLITWLSEKAMNMMCYERRLPHSRLYVKNNVKIKEDSWNLKTSRQLP